MGCNFTSAELLQVIPNPALIPNFVRPDWDEAAMDADESFPHTEWLLKIFIGGQAYRFDFFLIDEKSRRLNFEDVVAEKSRLVFWLNDSKNDIRSDLPFIPPDEAYTELWDKSGHCYYSGFIASVFKEEIMGQRPDLTVLSVIKVEVKSLYGELERDPIEVEYLNATPGIALKNAIKQYAPIFDVSEIPIDLGAEQPSIKWVGITLSQALDRVCSLTNSTYIIEPDTHKIRIGSKDAAFAQTGIQLTDANVFQIGGLLSRPEDLTIGRDVSQLKTQIVFHYYEKFSRGTVDVGNGDSAWLGHGATPQTFWDGRKTGGKIRIKGATDVYTVNDNQSAGVVQTLICSPAYTGADATNQEYIWTGEKTKIVYQDEQARRTMASIRGGNDNGKFTMNVHDDQNEYFPWEAIQQAQALIAMSQPGTKGSLKTGNDLLQQLPLRAGMGLTADLPLTYGFQGNLTFYKIVFKSNGTRIDGSERADGLARPGMDIELVFTQTYTAFQAQMRQLLQKSQRTKISDEGNIDDVVDIGELLAIKTCYHAIDYENVELCRTNSRTGYTAAPPGLFFTAGGRAFPILQICQTNSRFGYTSSPGRKVYTAG